MKLPVLSWYSGVLLGLMLAASPAFSLEPEPLPKGDSYPTWAGPQFVQADRIGNVYFLRADNLSVYPMRKDGRFGEPAQFEATAAHGGSFYSAAMSASGSIWVLQDARSVRLFVSGKETPVPPLPWKPWSVTLLRDSPIVAVVPLPIGGRGVDIKKIGAPPWFIRLGEDRWENGVELKGISVAELLENDTLNDAIAENAAFMTGDRQGKLWIARQYAYHVERLNSSGRVLLDITVGGGKVRKKGEGKAVQISLHGASDNPSEATRNPRQEKGSYVPFTAQSAVEALTEGRDGRMYFFVRSEDGEAALDRYDPVRSVLERVPLHLKLKDRPSLAAGRDALYLAAWGGQDGRWRISWDTLDQAPWKRVENCKIDGVKAEE